MTPKEQAHIRSAEAREEAARARGYYIRPRVAYTSIVLPRPIGDDELRRYADLLQLSSAQFQAFQKRHDQFLESQWAYRMEHVQPLVERSAEYASLRQQGETVEIAEFGKRLQLDVNDVFERIASREDEFFTAFIPFLSDAQVQHLDRVRDLRSRIRNREHVIIPSPGAAIDLTEILWELRQADYELTPTDDVVFTGEIRAYEQAATRLFDRMAQFRMNEGWKVNTLLAQVNKLAVTIEDPEVARAAAQPLLEERDRINRNRHRTFRRIHDLNRQYAYKLAELLPKEAGDALLDEFRQRAYPVVYPDRYDIEIVFEKALEVASLSDEQRQIIDALMLSFVDRRDDLDARMVDEYLEWHASREKSSGYEPLDLEEYRDSLYMLQ